MTGVTGPGNGPGLGEAVAVWAMLGLEAVAIGVGRGRGRSGDHATGVARFGEGADRVAAFLGHPVAPAAVPLGLLAAVRLAQRPTSGGRASGGTIGPLSVGVAVMLGLGLGLGRGALRPGDGAAVVGGGFVATSLASTVVAVRHRGVGGWARREPADVMRVGLGAALFVLALPWLLADLGIYADDLPLLRRVYVARRRLPTDAAAAAVHLGHHHGLDGALLGWTGLLLSRQVSAVRRTASREGLALAVAFLIVYGSARAVEDAWSEQVVKRGMARVLLPRLVVAGRPTGVAAWSGLVAATAVLDAIARPRVARAPGRRTGLGEAVAGLIGALSGGE